MSGFNTKHFMKAARGNVPADIVFYNGEIFNPFTCEWENSGFAVKNGVVIGTGEYHGVQEYDLKGRRVVPGLIDAHVHIESSLLCPHEYARLVVKHGTTTVIADPHEIGNVCGSAGLEYILSEREGLPIDIFVMLPSCVPATPVDRGGAVLDASDLSEFKGISGVLGLAEVMNVPGVLTLDEEVWKKSGCSRLSMVTHHYLRAMILMPISLPEFRAIMNVPVPEKPLKNSGKACIYSSGKGLLKRT
jgi:Adenine deaminase